MECDTLFCCFLKPGDFSVALSPVVATSTMKLKYSFLVIETVRNFIHAKKKSHATDEICMYNDSGGEISISRPQSLVFECGVCSSVTRVDISRDLVVQIMSVHSKGGARWFSG